MKKVFCLILVSILVLSNCLSVFAYGETILDIEVDFDITQYSYEELAVIQRMIAEYFKHMSDDQAKLLGDEERTTDNQASVNAVLYNNNGVYIEYSGIKRWIIDLYYNNTSSNTILIAIENLRANRFVIDCANGGCTIPPNSTYLPRVTYNNIIRVEDLLAYGISTLNSLDFEISIWVWDMDNHTHLEQLPVTLNISMDVA